MQAGSNETAASVQAFVVAGKLVTERLGSCGVRFRSAFCGLPGLQYAFSYGRSGLSPAPEFLLRFETDSGGINDDFILMRPSYYQAAAMSLNYFLVSVFSIEFFVCLISVMLFMTFRESGFLFYSISSLLFLFSVLVNHGLWDRFFGTGDLPTAAALSAPVLCLSTLGEIRFVQAFFGLRKVDRRLNCCLWLVAGFVALMAFASAVPVLRGPAWPYVYVLRAATCLVLFGALASLTRRRLSWAGTLTAAWGVSTFCGVLWVLGRAGVVGGHWTLGYCAILGKLVESVIFTIANFQKVGELGRARDFAAATSRENRIIRTLFRTLSHDLSSTIQSLAGSSFAYKEATTDEERQEALQLMGQAIDAQIAIVKHAKRSYVGRGKDRVVKLAPVPVRDCLAKLKALFSVYLEDKRIQLKIAPYPESLCVLAEEVSFTHQVLANLLSNAIKFSSAGDETWIRVYGELDQVQIEVEDRGIGIPKELLADIFNEARDVSRPGTLGEAGTGLGLLIIRDFVHAYGGELKIEVHQGTRVTIRLKRAMAISPPKVGAPAEYTAAPA